MQPLTASSSAAVAAYDEAVFGYLSLSGDPLAHLSRATAADPLMPAAHSLTAAFLLLGTGATGAHPLVAAARRDAAACARRAGGALPREVALLLCVEALAAGRWALAARVLEARLAAAPADALLLRMAHDIYLFLGDSRSLRDSAARVFQTWDPTMAGFPFVCGMAAFGLGETGQLERAEELAMSALHMEPRDSWALHAAVHAYEMRGQREQGKQLLKEAEGDWTQSNIFSRHLHWHWALFAVEDGNVGYRGALSRCVAVGEGGAARASAHTRAHTHCTRRAPSNAHPPPTRARCPQLRRVRVHAAQRAAARGCAHRRNVPLVAPRAYARGRFAPTAARHRKALCCGGAHAAARGQRGRRRRRRRRHALGGPRNLLARIPARLGL
jgi:hypothetical protein